MSFGWIFFINYAHISKSPCFLVYKSLYFSRYTSYGYLYIAPGHMHPSIYIMYILGLITHMVWISLFNIRGPGLSVIVITIASVFLFVSYGLSCHRLYYRGHILQREGVQKEALYVRLFVQNAIAIYATWCVILSLLNLDMSLVYKVGVSREISGTVVHMLLLFYIIVWFFMDNFVCEKFLRYTFSPYLVFLLFQIGCFTHTCATSSEYMKVLVAFILCVAILAAVLKIILLIKNQVTSPLWLGNGFFIHKSTYGSLDIYKDQSNSQKSGDGVYYWWQINTLKFEYQAM